MKTPEEFLKEYPVTKENMEIILPPRYWKIFHDWMQEYSNQNTKQLIYEIERLNLKNELFVNSSKSIIDELKAKLKASGSVNEEKDKEIASLKEAYQLSCEVLQKFKLDILQLRNGIVLLNKWLTEKVPVKFVNIHPAKKIIEELTKSNQTK